MDAYLSSRETFKLLIAQSRGRVDTPGALHRANRCTADKHKHGRQHDQINRGGNGRENAVMAPLFILVAPTIAAGERMTLPSPRLCFYVRRKGNRLRTAEREGAFHEPWTWA